MRLKSYSHGYLRNDLDVICARLFPKTFASAGPAGRYLKRQPWNFWHPPILIPWSRVSSVQTASRTEYMAGAVKRQMEFHGLPLRAKRDADNVHPGRGY